MLVRRLCIRAIGRAERRRFSRSRNETATGASRLSPTRARRRPSAPCCSRFRSVHPRVIKRMGRSQKTPISQTSPSMSVGTRSVLRTAITSIQLKPGSADTAPSSSFFQAYVKELDHLLPLSQRLRELRGERPRPRQMAARSMSPLKHRKLTPAAVRLFDAQQLARRK